jgi:hypothetical protein
MIRIDVCRSGNHAFLPIPRYTMQAHRACPGRFWHVVEPRRSATRATSFSQRDKAVSTFGFGLRRKGSVPFTVSAVFAGLFFELGEQS